MKKVLFLVAFFSLATVANLSAQSTPALATTSLTAAVEAAKSNPDIIQKEGKDGLISFSQKSVCSKSGKVSYKDVNYNAETATWTAASCSSKAKKSCSSSKKGASKKSCGSKAKTKSCCASKKGASKKSCGSKAKKS